MAMLVAYFVRDDVVDWAPSHKTKSYFTIFTTNCDSLDLPRYIFYILWFMAQFKWIQI